MWVFFPHIHIRFGEVLDFEKQTALRAPIENNVPGGAKGRVCPLIHRKTDSSSSIVA